MLINIHSQNKTYLLY